MFGFKNRRTAARDETELYMRALFTGLDRAEDSPLPTELFADPYIAGFLQVLTVHTVANIYHTRMPDEPAITAIMAEALDRMAPGYGTAAARAVAETADPAHARHADYLNGRRDGATHIRTLLATDEVVRDGPFHAFRAFVTRHYL